MPKIGQIKKCPGSIVYIGKHPAFGGGYIENFKCTYCGYKTNARSQAGRCCMTLRWDGEYWRF